MGLDAGELTRTNLRTDWADWLRTHGMIAQLFLTLTFDEVRIGKVSPERAIKAWRSALGSLMLNAWGRRYQRRWQRCSISYIAAVDYSTLGAVHLHVVVDGWLDFSYLHHIWQNRYGFAWVKQVEKDEDQRVALAHVTKYALKSDGALVDYWFTAAPHRKG